MIIAIKKLAVLASLTLLGLPLFASTVDLCTQKSIRSVSVPVVSGDPSKRFNYKFQYVQKNSTAPVIIIIPGGPGGTSISVDPDPVLQFDFQQILFGLPKNYNAIFTDPRSRGCNSTFSFAANELSTRGIVSDLMEMIRQLNLKKYILYGHSYGSVVAIELAHEIEKANNLPAPIAVLISGALSKVLKENEQDNWLELSWIQFKRTLSPKLQLLFSDTLQDIYKKSSFLLNVPGSNWYSKIGDGLSEGAASFHGTSTDLLADDLAKVLGSEADKDTLRTKLLVQKSVSLTPLQDAPIFIQIGCSEFWTGEFCQQAKVGLTHPFNSKDYQVKAPLIYASGSRDPAVGIENAYYGYLVQMTSVRKFFIEVKQGGHSNFFFTRNCSDQFWNSIFSGATDLSNVIKNCDPSVVLRTP